MKPSLATSDMGSNSPYMIMLKQSGPVRKAEIRRSTLSIDNCHEETNEQMALNLNKYYSLPRKSKAVSPRKNGTDHVHIKSTHEQLETELMKNVPKPSHYFNANTKQFQYKSNQNKNYQKEMQINLQRRHSHKQQSQYLAPGSRANTSTSIVARHEVPPDCVKASDPHKVKSRVMRLPYVSDGMMSMSNLHGGHVSDQKAPANRLCRYEIALHNIYIPVSIGRNCLNA